MYTDYCKVYTVHFTVNMVILNMQWCRVLVTLDSGGGGVPTQKEEGEGLDSYWHAGKLIKSTVLQCSEMTHSFIQCSIVADSSNQYSQ